MVDLEKLYEVLLPERKNIYSHLNMEYVTHADYTHTKRVYKDFEIKLWINIMTCMFKARHYS